MESFISLARRAPGWTVAAVLAIVLVLLTGVLVGVLVSRRPPEPSKDALATMRQVLREELLENNKRFEKGYDRLAKDYKELKAAVEKGQRSQNVSENPPSTTKLLMRVLREVERLRRDMMNFFKASPPTPQSPKVQFRPADQCILEISDNESDEEEETPPTPKSPTPPDHTTPTHQMRRSKHLPKPLRPLQPAIQSEKYQHQSRLRLLIPQYPSQQMQHRNLLPSALMRPQQSQNWFHTTQSQAICQGSDLSSQKWYEAMTPSYLLQASRSRSRNSRESVVGSAIHQTQMMQQETLLCIMKIQCPPQPPN